MGSITFWTSHGYPGAQEGRPNQKTGNWVPDDGQNTSQDASVIVRVFLVARTAPCLGYRVPWSQVTGYNGIDYIWTWSRYPGKPQGKWNTTRKTGIRPRPVGNFLEELCVSSARKCGRPLACCEDPWSGKSHSCRPSGPPAHPTDLFCCWRDPQNRDKCAIRMGSLHEELTNLSLTKVINSTT